MDSVFRFFVFWDKTHPCRRFATRFGYSSATQAFGGIVVFVSAPLRMLSTASAIPAARYGMAANACSSVFALWPTSTSKQCGAIC